MIAHLHVAQIDPLGAEPDDHDADAVHQKHHDGHHKGHHPVGEQLGSGQVAVGGVKALLLMLFAAEGANHRHAGKNLAADQIQPVYQGLHLFEFGHGHHHQHDDHHRNGRPRPRR